jgi:hypothetical protein
MKPSRLIVCLCLLAITLTSGCTTSKKSNTARTGVEQLLISNAIDQSLDKIDFEPFRGHAVYLEEKYVDCVDKNYLLASMRHRILRTGARLVSKPEEADIALELRSGVVGTDSTDMFVGIPEITVPGMVTIPELRMIEKTNQSGTAKIGLVAYDPKTGRILREGGHSLAQSTDSNWFAGGIGPVQTGSIRKEVADGTKIRRGQKLTPLPQQVAFRTEPADGEPAARYRLTSGPEK